MELSDEIIIPGNRKEVFAKLIDPTILKLCIPGCEELTMTEENKYSAKVLLKIGPIKAKFSGSVELDTANAPSRLTLNGAGEGGVAGFAKGGSEVMNMEYKGISFRAHLQQLNFIRKNLSICKQKSLWDFKHA